MAEISRLEKYHDKFVKRNQLNQKKIYIEELIKYFKEQDEKVKKENEGGKFKTLNDMEFQRKKKITRSNIKRHKPEPKYSPAFIKAIKDAEQEIKDGGGITFKSIDELKEYFKKMESDKNIELRKKGRGTPKSKRKCKCK